MSQQPDEIRKPPETDPGVVAPSARGEGRSALMYLLVLLLAAAVLAAVVYFNPLSHTSSSRRGPALASLSLEPLGPKGDKLTLQDLKGKVVLLNFWGTWCPPCRVEFPEIVALEKQYRGRGDVLVLAVSCGPPGGEDVDAKLAELRTQTRAFLDQHFVDLPVYLDPGSETRRVVEALGLLQGYPTTLLLDGQHRVVRHWPGRILKDQCEAAIEELLHKG